MYIVQIKQFKKTYILHANKWLTNIAIMMYFHKKTKEF